MPLLKFLYYWDSNIFPSPCDEGASKWKKKPVWNNSENVNVNLFLSFLKKWKCPWSNNFFVAFAIFLHSKLQSSINGEILPIYISKNCMKMSLIYLIIFCRICLHSKFQSSIHGEILPIYLTPDITPQDKYQTNFDVQRKDWMSPRQ